MGNQSTPKPHNTVSLPVVQPTTEPKEAWWPLLFLLLGFVATFAWMGVLVWAVVHLVA